jgi:hypothetical protein
MFGHMAYRFILLLLLQKFRTEEEEEHIFSGGTRNCAVSGFRWFANKLKTILLFSKKIHPFRCFSFPENCQKRCITSTITAARCAAFRAFRWVWAGEPASNKRRKEALLYLYIYSLSLVIELLLSNRERTKNYFESVKQILCLCMTFTISIFFEILNLLFSGPLVFVIVSKFNDIFLPFLITFVAKGRRKTTNGIRRRGFRWS